MIRLCVALCFLPLVACAQQQEHNKFLQDSSLTPGAVDPNATLEKVCTVGYTRTVRNVPESLKTRVFLNYKTNKYAQKYEIDHLISLEIGGSNDIKNLWPQPYTTTPWNAYKKDALENRLHKLVCEKKITLQEAQDAIRTDWVAAYKKYKGE